MIEKMVQRSGKNQSKLIKSVMSCGGHLARIDLSVYYSSAKYLSESSKTLHIESPKCYVIGSGKILLVNQSLSVPGLF